VDSFSAYRLDSGVLVLALSLDDWYGGKFSDISLKFFLAKLFKRSR
jgi:hypothetical protein